MITTLLIILFDSYIPRSLFCNVNTFAKYLLVTLSSCSIQSMQGQGPQLCCDPVQINHIGETVFVRLARKCP